jgi:tetratricopeptide (TPR) repeat protein
LFSSIFTFAQSVNEYVEEGITYHDAGRYSKAIELYKKALELEPNSPMVNYEISLSYFSNGDYENAIKYADAVLKQKSDYKTAAYITKGSSLDMMGKTKESIKLFEKAIKKEGGSYLLYYNLAINYVKINEVDKAEENLFKAVDDNPNHASSHLMISSIEDYRGNSVPAILSAHYFLFLEPNSSRSAAGYELLMKNFGGNVTVDEDDPNTINITLGALSGSEFGAAEMMVSMLAASSTLEENKDKSEQELFVKNTNSFFSIMGELKENDSDKKGLWWDFYTPFFYDISQSDYIETYCNYITQGVNPDTEEWLNQNENMLTEFKIWLKSH